MSISKSENHLTSHRCQPANTRWRKHIWPNLTHCTKPKQRFFAGISLRILESKHKNWMVLSHAQSLSLNVLKLWRLNFKIYSSLVIFQQILAMPPKKIDAPEQKPLIGRVGTNLKVGIVGVPNVGKSTFFNVLTKSAAPAENFPFCTIDPNENRVPVPDPRFDFLCEYHKPARWVAFYSLNVFMTARLISPRVGPCKQKSTIAWLKTKARLALLVLTAIL